MKRRDLLKGLSFLPFGINALRRTPKEEPKPEPVKPPEPKVAVRIPQRGAVSAWSETLKVGEDGYYFWEMDIPSK